MAKITIHTATYNRAYILNKAYESLKAQTCKDFEWIITDDGSTDNTEILIKSWLNQNNGFTIHYYKLDHVGIPRALNNGINHANTKWFMMLDSDDWIIPVTIEHVLKWINEIEDKLNFAGVGFCRCFPNGDYMKPQIPLIDSKLGYIDATHIERAKYKLDMDMCEVHRISILKKYPFQVYTNEKYAPEQLAFYSMALDGYKLRWRNEKLYICDYLPDGQTKNNKIVKNNPMGFAMMYNQNLLIYTKFKDKLYNATQMVALSFYANQLCYLKKTNNIFITIIAFLPGIILGLRRYIQFTKKNK